MEKPYTILAKSLIITILNKNGEPTKDDLIELYEIKTGNKEVLLGHIKAISKIMDGAIKELEEVK